MDGFVKTELNNTIATIEFYHPAHNSMPSYQLKSLKENIDRCSEDDNVKVILLKSSGDRSFCAGASFTELASITNEEESKTEDGDKLDEKPKTVRFVGCCKFQGS